MARPFRVGTKVVRADDPARSKDKLFIGTVSDVSDADPINREEAAETWGGKGSPYDYTVDWPDGPGIENGAGLTALTSAHGWF